MAEQELAQVLDQVFAPFPPDQKSKLLAWAKEYLDSRWVLQQVYAEGKPDDHGRATEIAWVIGDPSPHNAGLVIFAIVEDERGLICAYSVGTGKDAAGKEGNLFFKEVIYAPRTAFGPISGDALFSDFERIFDEPDEPEPEGKPAGSA